MKKQRQSLFVPLTQEKRDAIRQRDAARAALVRIANSLELVLTSSRVPPKMTDGLRSVIFEAREGLELSQ